MDGSAPKPLSPDEKLITELKNSFGLEITPEMPRLSNHGYFRTIKAARHQIMTLLFKAGIPMNQEKRNELTRILEATIIHKV